MMRHGFDVSHSLAATDSLRKIEESVMTKARIGETVTVEMPWSEVNMHMRIAGKTMPVRVQSNGAQILNADGTDFSFPITYGEAGITVDLIDPETGEPFHVGHFSRMGGTWYCDTCNSPYCDLA
jgi:hypothetical protein